MSDLFLAGSIAIDRIMNFDGRFEEAIKPDKLHVLSLSVLLNSIKDTHGGVAANIAYNLALLGEKPVLVGSVGPNGKEYIEKLSKLGIDTSAVHIADIPTASFTVLTDSNDCQVGGFYPGAMAVGGPISLAEIVKNKAENPDRSLIVVSAHDPQLMRQQVAACKANNWRLFYDISQQVSNVPAEDLKAGIEAAELLIVNDYEMDVLVKRTGWSQAQILEQVPVIVVTLGEKGSQIFDSRSGKQVETNVSAVKKVKVVDPTGAGDAFRAGFIYGYVRDWSLEQCAQLGSVVASFALQKHGTQEHDFSALKIEQRFSSTYNRKIALS